VYFVSGVYEIQVKALMSRNQVLLGPSVVISIQADGTKPVSLQVDYDMPTSVLAGTALPGIAISLILK